MKIRELSFREDDLCVAQNKFQLLLSAYEKKAMSDHKKNIERKKFHVN